MRILQVTGLQIPLTRVVSIWRWKKTRNVITEVTWTKLSLLQDAIKLEQFNIWLLYLYRESYILKEHNH